MLYCSAYDEYEYGNKHRAYNVWLSTVSQHVQIAAQQQISIPNKQNRKDAQNQSGKYGYFNCQILISFCF
jgi:hypothetical protein